MPMKTKAGIAGKRAHADVARKAGHAAKEKAREDSLREVLVGKLQELYDVEERIVKGLPKLMKKATDPDLREAMDRHTRQTEGHMKRLEEAFRIMEFKPHKRKSEAMEGLADDAEEVIAGTKGAAARDAALIAALRAVEHYEVAGYGAAREWAELVGERQVGELLEETLHEEEETADALADLALSKVNPAAADGADEATAGGGSAIFLGASMVRTLSVDREKIMDDQEEEVVVDSEIEGDEEDDEDDEKEEAK